MNKEAQPIAMESYFKPGFKAKPAVFVGSQTHEMIRGNREEQAWEGYHLAGASGTDIAVVRGIDPQYINYWKSLTGNREVVNLPPDTNGSFLSQAILDNPQVIQTIKERSGNNASLNVFFPTPLEQRLADTLELPLHASPEMNARYGTKSGIRRLAAEAGIPMAPGYIAHTRTEIEQALAELNGRFDNAVIKHDESFSGYFTKKVPLHTPYNLTEVLDHVAGGSFVDGRDTFVVEGWVGSKASLCAHIEIPRDGDPIVCAGWQQVIDDDGITYLGGGPLRLSQKAMSSFTDSLHKLASALKKEGAVGSYGPDFLVVSDEEQNCEPDSCILIELNARVPYTAFPLEIIKTVRGEIGTGFQSRHLSVQPGTKFTEIAQTLADNNLLIREPDSNATGIVPFNVGMLPYGLFDIVAMANTWDEAGSIMNRTATLFPQIKASPESA
jgi:hypothetical protein